MDRRALMAAAVLAVLVPVTVAAQTDLAFMPDGGRAYLLALFDREPETVAGIVKARRGAAAWETWLAARPDLKERERRTLAGYLSITMPLDGAAALQEKVAFETALPPDGKQLAVENCQFCHSFFTGYLTQSRDADGWRAIFKAPFHKEIRMTPAERETFALYSAANMPLPTETVPQELRY